MSRTLLASLIVCFSVFAQAQDVDPLANPPVPAFEGQTDAPTAYSNVQYRTEVLLADLVQPRSLVPLPDGQIIIVDGAGRARILDKEGQYRGDISGMPAIRSVAGRSLNDFILDANFSSSRKVFLTYQAPPEGEMGGEVSPQQQGEISQVPRIAAAELSRDFRRLENVEVLAEIAGRRMASANDGSLYISTMGHGEGRPEVQQLNFYTGKILRVNADGSAPLDNPFQGRPNALPEIFAIGHRDPDGMFVHPDSGELWTIEHGPMGGDELNVIRPGQNSGWPIATYGKNYDGTEIGPSRVDGTVQPLYYWFPSVAPSGLMMYTGMAFPDWQGDIFVGTMSPTQGKFLLRLEMDGETVVAEERLLEDLDRRVRDVAQGVDGSIYVLTDSEDNAATGRHFMGQVLKLTPL